MRCLVRFRHRNRYRLRNFPLSRRQRDGRTYAGQGDDTECCTGRYHGRTHHRAIRLHASSTAPKQCRSGAPGQYCQSICNIDNGNLESDVAVTYVRDGATETVSCRQGRLGRLSRHVAGNLSGCAPGTGGLRNAFPCARRWFTPAYLLRNWQSLKNCAGYGMPIVRAASSSASACVCQSALVTIATPARPMNRSILHLQHIPLAAGFASRRAISSRPSVPVADAF